MITDTANLDYKENDINANFYDLIDLILLRPLILGLDQSKVLRGCGFLRLLVFARYFF